MLNEPRLTDEKECGPPLSTTALYRAPLPATPTMPNEPRLTEEKKYRPPLGTKPPS